VAYSPEREDPGRKDESTKTIPKLVGGIDAASTDVAAALYGKAVREVVRVSSCEVAESAKLLENIYRAVNIALVNEMKTLLTPMGVDVWEVIEAAATKPFGFQAFWPGPGLGGHCIPIDPFYLTWKAREVGESTRFIELAGQVNHRMPGYVVDRLMLGLNQHGKAVKGSRVLVLGLAYKPNVDDVRESPSFELIRRLRGLGAEVDYHDPHVPATHPMRHYPDLPPMQSIAWSDDAVAGYDCVLIATHHDAYDWDAVGRSAQLVVDTRGVMRGRGLPGERLVMA
jgi:UDP-N-acetyl-D-glucosamine dehydrogenase